jgi:hypothetical protein
VRLFADALIDRFTGLPPWLLGPDGRGFVIDETRAQPGRVAPETMSLYGGPVFDRIEAIGPVRELDDSV